MYKITRAFQAQAIMLTGLNNCLFLPYTPFDMLLRRTRLSIIPLFVTAITGL